MSISCPNTHGCLGLFPSVSDRKLEEKEFPHKLYVEKYSGKDSASSHIVLRKWLFTHTHEVLANSQPAALDLFFQQVSRWGENVGEERGRGGGWGGGEMWLYIIVLCMVLWHLILQWSLQCKTPASDHLPYKTTPTL